MTAKVTSLAPSQFAKGNPHATNIRQPGQLLCPDGFTFERLERILQRHLYRQTIPSIMDKADRFLLVVGPPGTSKTVTCCDAALRFNWAVANLPAASLAGESEGSATATLTTFFEGMVDYSTSTGYRVAVVMDDFELSILGADSKTGKTINSGLLINELQRIADRPKPYRNHDGSVIPLIFTANDVSNIRSSLIRDQRCTEYIHTPTFEEKIYFAFHILKPKTGDELRLVDKLVRTYRHQPVAFFASIVSDLHTAHTYPVSSGMAWAELKRR